MNNSFKLLFHLRKPKQYKAGPQPIYLRITINGQRAEISTQRDCDPKAWNADAGRMIGIKEAARQLNAYLDSLVTKIYECQTELIRNNLPVTADSIKNRFNGKDELARMLVPIFEQHNKEVEKLLGKGYALGTLERYRTTLQHVVEFMEKKYGFRDINIKLLNHEFVTDFNFFLRTDRGCGNNSAVKYIKNFKKIILICLTNGWLDKDPFIKFKQKVKEVERAFLTEEELQALCKKEFPIHRTQLVKDLFVFSCYTGLAYIDAKNLTKENLVLGIDGNYWIHTHRKKTDIPSHIPLLQPALEIIEKYGTHPTAVHRALLLPFLSNQKMNSYLKEVADACGINKELTFHIARHTFATTVTLSKGVPLESVSKMLGHTNIKTTQHYAKILDLKVSNDMNFLIEQYKPGLKVVKRDQAVS